VLAPDSRRVEIYYEEQVIASSHTSYRVLETASPPTFYIPPGNVNWELLVPAPENFTAAGLLMKLSVRLRASRERSTGNRHFDLGAKE
jgi:hypothetical protein